MDLLLENHALTDFLGLIWFGHVIGLVQGDLLLFSIHHDAAPLVNVVCNKGHTRPGKLSVQCARTRMGPENGDPDSIALGIDPLGWIKAGHITHLRSIEFCVRLGPGFSSPGWPPKIPHLWPLENPPPSGCF